LTSSSKSYYTYVLRCRDDSLYTGYTDDLKKRINAHNQGNGAKYTRGRLPVELVYYEEFPSRSCAMKREREIKNMTKSKKEALFVRKSQSL